MTGFMPQRAESTVWTKNALGAEVSRVFTNGAMLTVVRGKQGDLVPDHGYTHGAATYVVSGTVDIDGHELSAGDAGSYRGGSGYYAVKFLTDAVYVVARTAEDQLTIPDIGERAAAHLDA
jgi:hypothetical protein